MSSPRKLKSLTTWILVSVIPLLVLIAILFIGGFSKTNIFPKLDKNASAVIFWLAFTLPFAVVMVVVFRVFLKPLTNFFGMNRETKKILSAGRPAMALVKQIGESSIGGALTINEQPYLNLQLEIRDGNRPPYSVGLDTIIPRSAVPRFQPGAVIPVKIDPSDPAKIAIDWSGGIGARGAQQPSAAAEGMPTAGNTDEWTESDNRLLAEQGIDGTAKLLSLEDTGRSENFNPVVRVSYEVRARNMDTYTFSKEVPLPSQTIALLKGVLRKSFPARIHPHDRTKIKVNVTF